MKVLSPGNADRLLRELQISLRAAGAEGVLLSGMEPVDAYLCGLLHLGGRVELVTRGSQQFIVWLKRRRTNPPIFRQE